MMREQILKVLESQKDVPVVIGPWIGEIGHELQYWIPFIRKIKDEGYFGSRRIAVISRGGVDGWYSGITDEYHEIFDYMNGEEFKKILVTRDLKKQVVLTNEEDELVGKIVKKKSLGKYILIHPSVMWVAIAPYFEYQPDRPQVNLECLFEMLSFIRNNDPFEKYSRIVDALKLPEDYFAVKFYTSTQYVPNEEKAKFMFDFMTNLTKKNHAVVMGLSRTVDDHLMISFNDFKNLTDVSHQLELSSNLGVQTEIVRRSKGYVGTCGGMALLPIFLGKMSLSFITESLKNYTEYYYKHEMMISKFSQLLNQNHCVLHYKEWNFISENFF